MTTSTDIENRIIDAVLSQKLAPGTRLGEQQLAGLFDCSRTLVREALTRLSTRGIVTVSARRGWYVIEPSIEEAKEAFAARRVVELGMIRHLTQLHAPELKRLKAHIRQEKAALKGNDVGARSFLLGDFHVCLAECIGNSLLADTLRDFTARTTLIAMMYQSSHDAEQSCEEHRHIVAALESGDMAKAEALMSEHIGGVQSALQASSQQDPLAHLREALAPAADGSADAPTKSLATAPKARRKRSLPTSDVSSEGTYLGDLL